MLHTSLFKVQIPLQIHHHKLQLQIAALYLRASFYITNHIITVLYFKYNFLCYKFRFVYCKSHFDVSNTAQALQTALCMFQIQSYVTKFTYLAYLQTLFPVANYSLVLQKPLLYLKQYFYITISTLCISNTLWVLQISLMY
jgi:hypothetical protein